ncbi:hypothetical protein [Stieleria varia]|uniref:Uncharacterized protein n=1 Tax=Stieleria varia TaxID=2528005 RepID=A0A5C6BCI2_9BACT|nr:hypothetical protein [Stieleria varia]TWU08184.1 hypothetical protein Pla52n_07660 [Stieleria varia]
MRRMTKRRKQSKRRDGYVMLIVMMLILTTTAFAAVHQRHLASALRIEQARMLSEDRIAGPVAVMAVACERLESGQPPSPSAYQYTQTVRGTAVLYRIDYQLNGSRWTVSANPDPSATGLAVLPASF